MNTFKVSLNKWMMANDERIPVGHTVEVEDKGRTLTGKVIGPANYNFEDRDGDIQTISGVRVELFMGETGIYPIYSTNIVLSIDVLKEKEMSY